MPRGRVKGDHGAKRSEVARAACTVILRQGLAATSLSDIAREMGYTTGVIRHYFSDKEELLLYSKNLLFDESMSSAQRAAEGCEGLDKLKAMVRELLPLDARSVDRYRLLATFNGHAIGNARLMKIQHGRNERHSRIFADVVAELQSRGHVANELDPKLEAWAILALSDGLADQVIMSPGSLTSAQLLQVIDAYIDGLGSRPNRGPRAPRVASARLRAR
jgi:AcrR family transcriptional regulator